jgi:hypothetical protein
LKNVERTFISYSSKDFQLVTDLVKHLEAQGVNCWYAPRNIVPGKHYASSILEAIRACNAFVIVFSKNSNASEQCLKEVDRAVNARKPIIPFRIDETMPTEAMDYYLCNTHWLNAYEEVVTNYYQQLVHAVHDFISTEQEKTEYVTDVKPSQPQQETISRELQDVIQSLRDEAIRDEEAAAKYREEKEKLEEELEAKKNATVVQFPQDRTKQIIKQESKPLVIQPKKRREFKKRTFEEEEGTFEKVKKKVVLPLALIAVSVAFYMYRSVTSDNTINVVEGKKKVKVNDKKKKENDTPIVKVDYRKDFLNKKEIETYGIEKLKEIKNIISTRDGNIIRRTRSGLVESEWSLREVQNYFLLDHLIYEKARPTNKGLTSRVYLGFDFPKKDDPERPGKKLKNDPMRIKTLWEAGSMLLKEKLYDEDLNLMYLRIHPEGNLTSFPKSGELVITLRIVENEERFVKVIQSGGMKLTDSINDLRQFTENINLDLKIAEAGSSWPSKEIIIEYNLPKLNLDGYKSISVQLVDIARLFVSSKKLLSSI